jgi:hypothetical protein
MKFNIMSSLRRLILPLAVGLMLPHDASAVLPAPAYNLKLTAAGPNAVLTWNGTIGVLYQVESAPGLQGPWQAVGVPTTDSAFTNIMTDSIQFFRVGIFTNTSDYTANVARYKGDKAAPTVPTGLTATATGCNQVYLSWNPSTDLGTKVGGTTYTSGLKGYNIYRGGVFLKQVLAPATSTTDTSVAGSSAYTYAVGAIDNAGNSSTLSSAVFVTTPACSSCTATVTTSSSPSAGGTTTGGRTVNCGSGVTVTASANAGYAFANWTENGTVVSTSVNYPFTANANRTLVANFSAVACTYAISSSTSPVGAGSTSGGGTVSCGSYVYMSAAANAGYAFANWTENGNVVSGTANFSFPANANRSLVANFTANSVSYTITTGSSPSAGGTTSGGRTVSSGTVVTVTAVPNAGYNFVNWTENGSVLSSSANYSFTANANRNLVANFTTVACTDTISSSVSPVGAGSTSGGGTVSCGSYVYMSAAANAGYTFVNWTENGNVVSGTANFSFPANANRSLVANFTANSVSYTITTGSSPSAGGTTSGGRTVSSGSAVTVTAAPNAGYSFVNWTENGTVVSFSANYSFTANANRNLVANFTTAQVSYTITTSSSPTAGGSTSGGSTVIAGSAITVTATPNAGYNFTYWTENGTVVSASTVYTFTANANRNLVANFTAASPSGPWSKAFGGSSTVVGQGVAVEASTGNIVISGYFAGTADFGAGLLTSAGAYDLFLAKYSPAGVCLWSKRFGSAAGSETPMAAALDSNGNIFVAGAFVSTIDVGGGALINAGQKDIFLAKYSASGQYLWSKRFGGAGMDTVNSLATDGNGDVIMTGSFDETCMWMPDGSIQGGMSFGGVSLCDRFAEDTYVAKLAGTDGHQIWAVSFNNGGLDIGYGVTVDRQGDVFITGSFINYIDFGGGNLLGVGGNLDVYVAKLSGANGSYLWARSFGDVFPDSGVALATDQTGDVFVTGYYNSASIDFGCGALTKAAGNADGFLAKLSGASGACKWSKAFSGPGDKGSRGVAVDKDGNVVVAGVFPYSINIGGTLLTASGTSDTFLAKFSNTGSLVSASHFGGVGASTSSSGVATDAGGNIVLTGSLYGTANFGGTSLTSTASGDAFLIRVNP